MKIPFPNLKMYAGNVEFTVRKPFDMFMNFEERPTWLPNIDEFRTFEYEIMQTMNRKLICDGLHLM